MSNLIITIISIGLVAIAATMGIYYGGTAYENGQINTIATSIVNESQQILAAQRMWATNNNQPDATNAGLNTLVTGNELAEYPSLAGNQLGVTGTGGTYDLVCYNIQGYQGLLVRTPFILNNGNYVAYIFTVNSPYNGNCTNTGSGGMNGNFGNMPQHPIMKITTAINNSLGAKPPAGGGIYNGMIYSSVNNYIPSSAGWFGILISTSIEYDANGNMITNMCYYNNGNPGCCGERITCVFGPS